MMAAFNKLILGVGVSSFAIFQLLFHILSSWVSARVTSGFNNLDQKKKIEWNSRTVSTFHALVVGAFCLYILLYDDAVNADHVWGDPSIVKLNLAITTGYLISAFPVCASIFNGATGITLLLLLLWYGVKEKGSRHQRIFVFLIATVLFSFPRDMKLHRPEDVLLIIFYWKAIGDIFFVIHHLVALYAYYFVLDRGLLAYFANFRLLAEFSTPFVNQRWFFEVLGYSKSSKGNIINGVLMTVVFFLARIAVIPVYYSHVAFEYGTEAFHRLGFAAQSAWFISSIVLDVMNLMWMVKITKGCYKVICLIGQGEVKAHKNGKSD